MWGKRSEEKQKEGEKRREKMSKQEKIKTYSYRFPDGETDRRTDRHKSFIDMRYNTEQYSKSDSIKSNQIESNRINLKWNRLEWNGEQISWIDKIKEHEI